MNNKILGAIMLVSFFGILLIHPIMFFGLEKTLRILFFFFGAACLGFIMGLLYAGGLFLLTSRDN